MHGILSVLHEYIKYIIFKKLAFCPLSFMSVFKIKISNVKGTVSKAPILFSLNVLKTY